MICLMSWRYDIGIMIRFLCNKKKPVGFAFSPKGGRGATGVAINSIA